MVIQYIMHISVATSVRVNKMASIWTKLMKRQIQKKKKIKNMIKEMLLTTIQSEQHFEQIISSFDKIEYLYVAKILIIFAYMQL